MMKPFQVWKDVYAIGGAEVSHPYDCCVYLIDAGDLVLIDTGAGSSFDQLVENIALLGFDPEKLDAVMVTHAHIDHIGAVYQFQQRFKVKVIAHDLDANAIESGRGTGAEFYGVRYHPCQVDLRLKKETEKASLGHYEFNMLHIPGHTPGSIAIYLDLDKRVLFGQDIHGPYEPSWGADPAQAAISLRKLIALQADVLCEGHFGIYQPAAEVERYIEGYLRQIEITPREHDA